MGKKVQPTKSNSKQPNKSKQTKKIKKDDKSSKKSDKRVTKAPKKYSADSEQSSPVKSASPISKSKKAQKKPEAKEVRDVVEEQQDNSSKNFKPKVNKNPADFPSGAVELSSLLQSVIKELKSRASFKNIHLHLEANFKSVDAFLVNRAIGSLENQGVIVPPNNRTAYYIIYQDLDEKPNTVIDVESEGGHNEPQEANKQAQPNGESEIILENHAEENAHAAPEENRPEAEENQVKPQEESSHNDIEVVMENNVEEGKRTGAKSTEKGSAKKESARKSSRKSTKKSASKSAIKEPADYDDVDLAEI